MNNKAAKILVFIFFCIFSLNIYINSFGITPPLNDVLINALSKNGEPNQNVVNNTDLFFVYNAVPVSKIKSEDELRELVFKSNTDTIDMKYSNWVVTEHKTSNEYFERVLSYDKNGKLFEAENLIYEDKNYTTITLMSELLGEQYNTRMTNILLLGADRATPFGSVLLVKVFDDDSLKVGVLVDIERDKISIKRGWYSFDEIKKFIALYNSDKISVGNSIILLIGGLIAVLSVGFILYKKYSIRFIL